MRFVEFDHSRFVNESPRRTSAVLPPFSSPMTGGEPPTEPRPSSHRRALDRTEPRTPPRTRARFSSVSIPPPTRETGDRTRPQTHEMTRARDLAQLSGHSEADCEEVLAQCHGDVDRAIDRLLNSA